MWLLAACTADPIPVDSKETDAPVDTAPEQIPGDSDADTASPVSDVGITVHPRVTTILVVDWSQDRPADAAWLSWTLDGEEHTSPARSIEVGEAEDVVLGLPAETAVDVVLHVTVEGVTTDTALPTTSTGALPDDLLVPTLNLADPTKMRPEPYLLTSVNVGPQNFFGPCYVVIVDAQGRIVWYHDVGDNRLTIFPRVSRSGDGLIWEATTYYSFAGEPAVIRATLDLSLDAETPVPGMGLTYDELEDGSILFDDDQDGTHYFLGKQAPDGTQSRLWACLPWMSTYSSGYWACAPNTVAWYPERGTVLWSTFETDTVAEIDPDNGEVLRVFGAHPDSYAFDPEESAFELQHYPNWTADGTLIVSTHDSTGAHKQWAREYEVDDDGRTLHEVWSYTPSAGYFADYAGQVQILPSGNRLWQLGTAGIVQELTEEGEVVWELDWARHLTGNVTPIEDLYVLRG